MLKKLLVIFQFLVFGLLPGESSQNEAELVYPQLLNARDELGTRTLRINDKVILELKKSSVVHDEFLLITHRDGVPLRTYPDVDKLEEGLFHDEKYLASVFVTEDRGFVKVEGVVGPNLKIRPLEGMERGNEGFFPHTLEPIIKEKDNGPKVHGERIQARSAQVEGRYTSNGISDRSKVTKIHPEVRLVVDELFVSGFKTIKEMVRYIMIEMNGVRLRYLTVDNPAVHIKLRAIEILAADIECQYYDYLDDKDHIDGITTIYRLADLVEDYAYKYKLYDIVYFVTGYDIVRLNNGQWETNYQGFAFVAAVCNRYRVGLSEDYAFSYMGIRVIAHELAHSLGCSHDGNEEVSYLDGYYANSTGCPWSQGFIMSYVRKDANSMKFSHCCDLSISYVAWSRNIDCLHELTKGTRLKKYKTRTLPGFFLSRDRQCKMSYTRDKTTYFNKKNGTTRCEAQCCVMWQGSLHCWQQLLLDGTRCGKYKKRVCINGDCMKKLRRYPNKPVGE